MRLLAAWILALFLGPFLMGQSLQIHHIDVGQGDSTLFVGPTGKTLLIDAGLDGQGTAKVLPYLKALGITKLDYVVASHYHSDHMGGLDEVINGLGGANVGVVLDRGTAHAAPTTTAYTSYASAAAKASGGRKAVTLGQVVDLGGGATLKVLASDGSVLGYGAVANATSSENDLSLAWLVSYGEFRYFTGGDCGGESSYYANLEGPLGQYAGMGQVDALKVDHHGSKYSSNATFLSTIAPRTAFVPVGNGNSYGHPTQVALDRLVAAGAYVYQTELGTGGTLATGKGVAVNGDILLATTGHRTYTVTWPKGTGTQVDTWNLHLQPASVTVAISPATAAVQARGTAAFTATVTGGTAGTVTWTCTGGTVTQAGLYTAGPVAGTFSVTATSVDDPTRSASAAITVRAPAVRNDFDGDGRTDLLWRHAVTGMLWETPMDGPTPLPGDSPWTEAGASWSIVGTGDFNADGKADLLWRNASNGMIYVQYMDGLAVASGAVLHQEPDLNWKVAAVCDVDGDGRSDLVWRHAVSGAVYVMPLTAAGPGAGAVVWTEPDPSWVIAGAGDLDGDGKADLLWRNEGTGFVYAMFLDGAALKGGRMLHQEPDLAWRIVALADFDADGITDLLWRHGTTGAVYLMPLTVSGPAAGTIIWTEPDLTWQIEAVGDFDADGKADILFRNANDGRLFQLLMNGSSVKGGAIVYQEPDLNWRLQAGGVVPPALVKRSIVN